MSVATINLVADELDGLHAQSCLDRYGAEACVAYPNPLVCSNLKVDVLAGGQLRYSCVHHDGSSSEGVDEGEHTVPVRCAATAATGCMFCMDMYGNVLLDACAADGDTLAFRLRTGVDPSAYGDSHLDGGVVDPLPDAGEPETPGELDPCDPITSAQRFVDAFNDLFEREGIPVGWVPPDLSKAINPATTWFKYLPFGEFDCRRPIEIIDATRGADTSCWDPEGTSCYCKVGWRDRPNPTCRCSRMTVAAVLQACAQIPPECDNYLQHSTAISRAELLAMFSINAPEKLNGSKETGGFHNSNTVPDCKASPLVFDLHDDGFNFTSKSDGIKFSFDPAMQVNTSWIQGDDALLVWDRNGNGQIDDGNELFGDATTIHGWRAEHGFQALAQLDARFMGGNGNGLVDANDLFFSDLRLWRDQLRNGIADRGELSRLSANDIAAIALDYSYTPDHEDDQGNSLAWKGHFIRSSGASGQIVDVLFDTKRNQ